MDYTALFNELEWWKLRETKQLVGDKPFAIFVNTDVDYHVIELYLSELCLYKLKVSDTIRLDLLKEFFLALFTVEEMTI